MARREAAGDKGSGRTMKASSVLRRRMPELDRSARHSMVLFYHALYASYVPLPGVFPIRHLLLSVTSPGVTG